MNHLISAALILQAFSADAAMVRLIEVPASISPLGVSGATPMSQALLPIRHFELPEGPIPLNVPGLFNELPEGIVPLPAPLPEAAAATPAQPAGGDSPDTASALGKALKAGATGLEIFDKGAPAKEAAGPAADEHAPAYLFAQSNGDLIYVDYSKGEFISYEKYFRVFVGKPGQMTGATVLEAARYRDGGTTLIVTSAGTLYVPSLFREDERPTWNGAVLAPLPTGDLAKIQPQKVAEPAAPAPYKPSRQGFLSQEFDRSGGKAKVAFFDADDTLRRSKSGKFVVNEPEDVEILANVGKKIKALNEQGMLVAIVSNQAGIPKHVSLENADKTLLKTIELIGEQGGRIHYFDFAENKDANRKPQTGMARTLKKALKADLGAEIDWKNSFMVGDAAYTKDDKRPDGTPGTNFSNSDRIFAENLGIPFIEAKEFFEREK